MPKTQIDVILKSVKYLTLATVCSDGRAWNTPLAVFRFGDDYVFYWASWRENQHSQNIRDNGRGFAVVYDSTPQDGEPLPGVYMLGRAFELTDQTEVMHAALVFKDDPYNPSDGNQYLGNYPRRIYKFVPEKFWLNDADKVGDNFVDIRKELNF